MDYWIKKLGDYMAKREKREFEAEGKSLSKEKTIYQTLKEMIGTDTKVYYLMWKFCPEFLRGAEKVPIKTFDDLKSRYKVFSDSITEEVCQKYMLEAGCQTAIKWLLKRLHQKKQIELYMTYYEKAKSGDVQAFKAFEDFSEKFFKGNQENQLTKLLNSIPDKELEEDENYDYVYEE